MSLTRSALQERFLSQALPPDPANFPFVVVGNKADEEANVAERQVKEWCEANGKAKYFACSAKSNTGVADAFFTVAAQAFGQVDKDFLEQYNASKQTARIDLSAAENRQMGNVEIQQEKKSCC
jgi:GTPase SAR1 family protein